MTRSPRVRMKDLPPEMREKAKELKRQEAAELRARFIAHCQSHGIPAPIPEHRFHVARQWRMDFAWPRELVYLEIEGGVWTSGRHTRGSGFLTDMEKYNTAACMGWRGIRVTPENLFSDETARLVRIAVVWCNNIR